MEKQEIKIETPKGEVYFFRHSLKTAWEHAEDYIERNKGKIEMKVFLLNESPFGERWIFDERIGIDTVTTEDATR